MANPEKQDPKQQKEPSPPPKDQPCESDYGCDDLPTGPEPPELCPPKTCDYRCNCPGKAKPPEPPCFDELIACQTSLVEQGTEADKIKNDLVAMRDAANDAKKTYTREVFDSLTKRWKDQDKDIVSAIQVVICNVPCWWCVIDCHICQLLYKIRWIEERLEGRPGKLITEAYSLRDLKHWHDRNVAEKERRFNYIDKVMKAWGNPAKSIDEALTLNEQIVASVRSMDPADALEKVFFDLIPRHLAIAPRPIDTDIEDKYIRLCTKCDEHEPDDCCGPDMGLPSARQLLVEPLAYIVDPDEFFDLLCCIATQRFQPAKQQHEKAKADRDKVNAEITNLEAELLRRKEKPLAEYRGSISTPIDCDKYKKKNGDDDGCGCDDGDGSSDGDSEENAS